MDYSYDYSYGGSNEIGGAGLAMMAGFWMMYLFLMLIFYVYSALCLMLIAKKVKEENAWWAWVPILNIILMLNIAKKPVWWIILMLIPLVNIVVLVVVWMEIAKRRGKPDWVGILMIVPVANLIVPAYLAFTE